MTFSSSANMYKHRQRLHKAEYAAYKQQAMPPNIIKQAKSGAGNKIRTKRRLIEGLKTNNESLNLVSQEHHIITPFTANVSVLNSHIVTTAAQYNLQ